MAYVAPTTRTTGTLITAAIWNQDVVANPIALYAGALSIASQAANDVLYAASATQLARLAAGTAGHVLKTNGAGSPPSWGLSSPIFNRDVLEQEVVSSMTETTVFTKTVPGNTLTGGEMLRLTAVGDIFNNSGAIRNLTIRVKFGSTVVARANFTSIAVAGDRYPVLIRVDLMAVNAGAQVARGEIYLGAAGTNGGVGGAASQSALSSHATVAENASSDLALAVTAELSASSSSLSFFMRTAELELI